MRLVWVLDTNDLHAAAEFWCAALGFEREEGQHPVYRSFARVPPASAGG
ncbi:VOC family protein [Nocardiopsis deserti]|nr:VOC family protein [Nocardiopsis deserti]